MTQIEQDIEAAKRFDQGLRGHRLAVEVERLRSIIADVKATAPSAPKVGDSYVRGTGRAEVVAVDETHVSYQVRGNIYKCTIEEFLRRASYNVKNGAQFIPAK